MSASKKDNKIRILLLVKKQLAKFIHVEATTSSVGTRYLLTLYDRGGQTKAGGPHVA